MNELLERLEQAVKALERPRQEYFSIKGAAALTGLSDKHIRRAIKRNELHCSNVGSEKRPTYRISRQEIEAWMEAKRVSYAPPKSERDALVEKYFRKRRAA